MGEALNDAQVGLEKAKQTVASWKATIQVCRQKIAEGAPWPGGNSDSTIGTQQHGT
jgi:hypothetical protein